MKHWLQKIFLFIYFSTAVICVGKAQYIVNFEIDNVPAKHVHDTLYLAGNFNDWNPGSIHFQLTKTSDGKFVKQIKIPSAGFLEYKITRGAWSRVECAADGASIGNRIIKISSDTTIYINVAAWADDMPQRPPVSTRTKNVFVLDTAFYIPQLNKKRRVWIYLPEEYALSKKVYPVLYMQDGQNLFDALTSAYGEWGVDELLDTVPDRRQWIIVGIDHGNDKRLTEYNPFDSKYGKGEGDAYADFLALTLKPYIDKRFRTKTDAANTAVAGSSMGGLISFYTAYKYPSVFAKAGVFSPAFWLAPELFSKVETKPAASSFFYFVSGDMEGGEMVKDMQRMHNLLLQKGGSKLKLTVIKNGRHNEAFWQAQMPDFIRWLNQVK
ncbi:alpha/beta hydrolase [Lacibacter luteus]|uniref:Alpha/beta hydrolase n=1 Tax=Lacibacter luteus TaxID=2508719 RepID=A0A4Q1CNS2_9BACT|nr:alpha/beta hydrolase-fold protein [Lacibacter luteus]RXK62484.1 alpha/beta hydrolase [Lacibacter luteus]